MRAGGSSLCLGTEVRDKLGEVDKGHIISALHSRLILGSLGGFWAGQWAGQVDKILETRGRENKEDDEQRDSSTGKKRQVDCYQP